MAEKDYLLTGCLKIELDNDIKIQIYSDGYSFADIEEAKDNAEKLKPNFKNPKLFTEFKKEKDGIINKLREFKYVADDNLFENFDNINIDDEEKVKEELKKGLTPCKIVKDIKIYEPPLGVEQSKGGKRKIVLEKEKGIMLPIPGSKKSNELFTTLCLMFQENASYYITIEQESNGSRKFDVKLSSGGEKGYITPYRGKEGGWTINYHNQLFYGEIEVWKKEVEKRTKEEMENRLVKIPILVYPKKLKVAEAEKIIKELLEWHSELIFGLKELTGLTIKPGEYGKKNPIQRLKFIHYLLEKRGLKKILNSIMENPDKRLVKEEVLKEIQDVETPASHLLPELIFEGTAIKRISSGSPHFKIGGKSYIFTEAYEEIYRVSYDTFPNRFVKFFLKYLKQELNTIEETLKSYVANDDTNKGFKEMVEKVFLEILKDMRDKNISRILNREFFNEVSDLKWFSAPSTVLLKDYRYQQVFTAFLDLIRGVSVSLELEELLKDPIRNMPELYEYWCFLKLWKGLLEIRSKGTPENSFKEKGIGYTVLEYGSRVDFDDGTSLIYNKQYQKSSDDFYSYSVSLRPDISLKIKDRLVFFDAKYRVDWIEEIKKLEKDGEVSEKGSSDEGVSKKGEQNEKEEDTEKLKKRSEEIEKEESRGIYKLGDLYKMHTYRDAIRNKEKTQPLWVIALYPGTKVELYEEDKKEVQINNIEDFLEKIKEKCDDLGKGVGAIPLKP